MSGLSLAFCLAVLCAGSTFAKWDRIRGTATQISARGDLMPVYIVNKNNELMRRDFSNNGWVKERDGVAHVGAGFDDSAWITTTTGDVFRGRNGNWQKVGTRNMEMVAGRNFYEALGVNNRNEIYHFIEDKWRRMPGTAVWVGFGIDGAKWAVNKAQNVLKWDHDKSSWTKLEGAAVNVDVYSAARIVVTNKDDEIFTWTGTGWRQEEGKCAQASVTLSNIFCVKRADSGIYRN